MIAIKAANKYFYDSKKKDESIYNVCALISTDKKGKLIFIDVEDNANPLPIELKKCLIDTFSEGDYSGLPSKTFGQPLTLTPAKRTHYLIKFIIIVLRLILVKNLNNLSIQ